MKISHIPIVLIVIFFFSLFNTNVLAEEIGACAMRIDNQACASSADNLQYCCTYFNLPNFRNSGANFQGVVWERGDTGDLSDYCEISTGGEYTDCNVVESYTASGPIKPCDPAYIGSLDRTGWIGKRDAAKLDSCPNYQSVW